MDQADFTGLIKTILIILFVYYLIKFSLKLLAPFILKKAVEKVQENFQKKTEEYFNQTQQNTNQNYQNHSSNTQNSNVKLKEKKKVGEYIDYEEID